MKLALRFRIDAIRVGEQIFNAIIDDDEHIEPMFDALTGEVCDVSVIYQGFLFLRDDRLGDEFDDMKIELSELFSGADDE